MLKVPNLKTKCTPLSYQCGGDTNWLLKPLVLQSPFGTHFFPLLPLGTSYTLCSPSPPRARHDLARQLGSSPTHSPAVKHELQVSWPTFVSNIVKSLVPKAVSHPFPPLPFPPLSHNFSWEVLASPIFETDAPNPIRLGVYNYMQSYMSCLSFLWKTLQFIFKKIKTFSHNLMPSNTRKHDPPPFYQGQTQAK